MEKIRKHLEENPVLFIATVGEDGAPKVRPFQYLFFDGGKLWFSTSNQKPVYRELKKEPRFECSSFSQDGIWIRLNGKAVFDEALAVKKRALSEREGLVSIYGTADNPEFELFYVDDGEAVLYSFSGEEHRAKI